MGFLLFTLWEFCVSCFHTDLFKRVLLIVSSVSNEDYLNVPERDELDIEKSVIYR